MSDPRALIASFLLPGEDIAGSALLQQQPRQSLAPPSSSLLSISMLQLPPSLLDELQSHVFPSLTSPGTTVGNRSPASRGDCAAFVPENRLARLPALSETVSILRRHVERVGPSLIGGLGGGKGGHLIPSVQVAVYKPSDNTEGSLNMGYARHCDGGHNGCASAPIMSAEEKGKKNKRVYTSIVYLNDVCDDDGGALRVYYPAEENISAEKSANENDNERCGELYYDVQPKVGRCVVFRSDVLEHGVRPVKCWRGAVTVWWYYEDREDQEDGKGRENRENRREPQPRNKQSLPPPGPLPSRPSLFVSIPCFADRELTPTIRSLLSNLTFFQEMKIFVGICLQIGEDKDSKEYLNDLELLPYSKWLKTNVRMVRMDWKCATGPCFARSVISGLYRGETYQLSIDCHTRFRKGWDEYLVALLSGECSAQSGEKAILTAYPAGYKIDPSTLEDIIDSRSKGTILVPTKFDTNGILRQSGKTLTNSAVTTGGAVNSPLWAAGFNFSRGQVIRDVPYLPNHFVFFGEEMDMAARLFTSGYDFFAPAEMYVFHLWERTQSGQRDNDGDWRGADEGGYKKRTEIQNVDVIKRMLEGEDITQRLGKERTIQQFEEAIGVDFKQQKVHQGKFREFHGGESSGGGGTSDAQKKVFALLGLNI